MKLFNLLINNNKDHFRRRETEAGAYGPVTLVLYNCNRSLQSSVSGRLEYGIILSLLWLAHSGSLPALLALCPQDLIQHSQTLH